MTQTPWTRQHVEYVEKARLTRKRGGFVVADVDRQLQRVIALMRAGQPVPQVAPTALRRTHLREGYAPDQVQALLDRIGSWQRELDRETQESEAVRVQQSGGQAPRRLLWTRQQQDWVRETLFAGRTGSRSYAVDDVDDFLDQVLVAMAKGDPLPDIVSVKFYPPRFGKSGYDAIQVDEFLDQLGTLRPALPGS